LIQSRLLWAVFLVVIVFSFVIWGMQSPNSGSADRTEGNVPGKLNGKEISSEEFHSAYTHVYAGLVLMYGRDIPQTRELRDTLEKSAWQRLAALRLAETMGLQVSDGEVVSAIRSIPTFQENGQFSLPRYQAVVGGLLREIGLSTQFFEQHIRQELALQRLQSLSDASFLVPPMDTDRMLSTITDEFTLDVVPLKPDLLAGQIQVPEEKVQAYFEENAEAYRIPRQLRIRAVRFKARPDATDLPDPTEEDFEDFYADHPDDFRVEPKPDSKEAARRQTLEEARPRMLERMRLEAAQARAQREAERFVSLIAPLISEAAPLSFDQAAEAMKVQPAEFGPFAATSDPEKVGVPRPMIRAAFELERGEPVSGAIPDGDDAGVLTVTERIATRIPDLKEVRERVAQDALKDAVNKALTERARALIARAGVVGLRTVAEAGKMECIAVEAISLSKMEDHKDLPFQARGLLRELVALSEKSVSEPIPDGKGGLLVAQILRRAPAAAEEIAILRPEVEAALKRERSRLAFEDLLAYLVRPEVFTNLRPLPEEEPDEDELPPADEAEAPQE
jgi:peptidyl-prolyl cis-trans isomerase D